MRLTWGVPQSLRRVRKISARPDGVPGLLRVHVMGKGVGTPSMVPW